MFNSLPLSLNQFLLNEGTGPKGVWSHPVGRLQVLDGCALCQKFRIGQDLKVHVGISTITLQHLRETRPGQFHCLLSRLRVALPDTEEHLRCISRRSVKDPV